MVGLNGPEEENTHLGPTPSHAAELAVLGAVLLAPKVAVRIDGLLSPADFAEPRHETIWNAIQEVRDGGVLPDALTVASKLTKQGDLTRIGGATYLHDLMQACPNPTNAPEYAASVRDAARLRQIDITATKLRQIVQSADPDRADQLLADALQALDETVRHVSRDKDKAVVNYQDEYLDRTELGEIPAPDWMIEGVIPGAAYGSEIGRDGTLKSFVAQDWSACIATGRPWQGRPTIQARVLYIAAEGAFGLRTRFDAWEKAWGVTIPEGALTIRKSALSLFKTSSEFDHLLELVSVGGYRFVVIDTLRRVSGSADGNSSDMGTIVDNIDRIKRATGDGTVLVIAHTDKGDRDTRGFSGIEDDADFVWHAKRDDNHLELTNTKMKDAPDGRVFHLQAKTSGDSLVLIEAGTTKPLATESQIKILDTLRHSFPDGAHTGKLRAGAGLTESTFYRVLADLKKAGHVVNIGTPKQPFYQRAILDDSQQLPPHKNLPDLHVSQPLPTTPTPKAATTTTPAALKSGSESTTTEKEAS